MTSSRAYASSTRSLLATGRADALITMNAGPLSVRWNSSETAHRSAAVAPSPHLPRIRSKCAPWLVKPPTVH